MLTSICVSFYRFRFGAHIIVEAQNKFARIVLSHATHTATLHIDNICNIFANVMTCLANDFNCLSVRFCYHYHGDIF